MFVNRTLFGASKPPPWVHAQQISSVRPPIAIRRLTPQTAPWEPQPGGRGTGRESVTRERALTGELLSETVFMLTERLSLSEDAEGGDGHLFSRGSCRRRYSRQARWMLQTQKRPGTRAVPPPRPQARTRAGGQGDRLWSRGTRARRMQLKKSEELA